MFAAESVSFLSEALHSPFIIPVVAIVGGLLLGAIGMLTSAWTKVRRVEAEAALKQEMLSRGMSAEDIERVVKASAVPAESD